MVKHFYRDVKIWGLCQGHQCVVSIEMDLLSTGCSLCVPLFVSAPLSGIPQIFDQQYYY